MSVKYFLFYLFYLNETMSLNLHTEQVFCEFVSFVKHCQNEENPFSF